MEAIHGGKLAGPLVEAPRTTGIARAGRSWVEFTARARRTMRRLVTSERAVSARAAAVGVPAAAELATWALLAGAVRSAIGPVLARAARWRWERGRVWGWERSRVRCWIRRWNHHALAPTGLGRCPQSILAFIACTNAWIRLKLPRWTARASCLRRLPLVFALWAVCARRGLKDPQVRQTGWAELANQTFRASRTLTGWLVPAGRADNA